MSFCATFNDGREQAASVCDSIHRKKLRARLNREKFELNGITVKAYLEAEWHDVIELKRCFVCKALRV
jgi:hypothetical protein